MKRSIMLGMVLVTMLVSLGGCFVGYPEHDRDGGHDRGSRHENDRSDRHYHDRDGEHDERR
jgi:predicted small lipoprotein YifL